LDQVNVKVPKVRHAEKDLHDQERKGGALPVIITKNSSKGAHQGTIANHVLKEFNTLSKSKNAFSAICL
jgi:hypothetical protein